MNQKDLVLAALHHERTDPIPYHVEFTAQALAALVDHTGDAAIAEKIGSCLRYIQYWGRPTEIPGRPEFFRDDFGVVWNRSGADKDIGVVDNPPIADLEQTDYTFPTCDFGRLRGEIEGLLSAGGDRFTMVAFGFALFERAWSLAGMEAILMGMVSCPDAVDDLLDRICDYVLQLLDVALEYDVDAIFFGDDWGQQRGLIMGPDHWRRFIKPRMARLYARVKAKGKFVFQHSCGDCREIFPDLLEIGLDCYQTFQPEIYDIAEMKRLYGGRLTFWGGISTQQCLPRMTPAQVQQEMVRVAQVARTGGGYILAPTHALPGDVPPENILAMAEVMHNQSKFF